MMWFLGVLWTIFTFMCGIGWDVTLWFIREMPGASCCCGVFLILAAIGLFQMAEAALGIVTSIAELIGSIFR